MAGAAGRRGRDGDAGRTRSLRTVLVAGLVGVVGAAGVMLGTGRLDFTGSRLGAALAPEPPSVRESAAELLLPASSLDAAKFTVTPIPAGEAARGGLVQAAAATEPANCTTPVARWAAAGAEVAAERVATGHSRYVVWVAKPGRDATGADLGAVEEYVARCAEHRQVLPAPPPAAGEPEAPALVREVTVTALPVANPGADRMVAYREAVSAQGGAPTSRRHYFAVKDGVAVLVYLEYLDPEAPNPEAYAADALDALLRGQLERIRAR